MNDIVTVDLGDRSYNIEIGSGLLNSTGKKILPFLHRKRAVTITDETISKLYMDHLEDSLQQYDIEHKYLVLPAGESTKSWDNLVQTVEWLLEQRVERNDLILALGGGVIGDLAGFAAAIVRRGVSYVQIPTSFLAQVDSSVGGKTGINSKSGKNLIGTFNQPKLVLADISVLSSLSRREFLAGYGEVVKYGLLCDAHFFAMLESNFQHISPNNTKLLSQIVRRSCEIKASIIAKDETEQGERALLNLGHTFGHALEVVTAYSTRLLHGEAVALGCMLAFEASSQLGYCSDAAVEKLRQHLEIMDIKTRLSQIPGPKLNTSNILKAMEQDKKRRDGCLKFVLAKDIGSAFLTTNVDMSKIASIIDKSLQN